MRLLCLLGIDLSEESQQLWPLCVRPRALGILAHVLVTAQDEQDKESVGCAHALCERAWVRLIASLSYKTINSQDSSVDGNAISLRCVVCSNSSIVRLLVLYWISVYMQPMVFVVVSP